jgi:hypothetical protein
MTERILTLHPAGKKGVNISKEKYDSVRAAVLQALEENETLSYRELGEKVDAILGDSFEGSKMWYYESVKLDLEARDVIQRTDRGGTHFLSLS